MVKLPAVRIPFAFHDILLCCLNECRDYTIVALLSEWLVPRLYNVTLYLSLIGLILSIASVVDSGQHKNIFKWLFFYMPTLWLFWIGCVFFVRPERLLRKLFFLWLIIDSAILALFISFSGTGDSWAKARDVDIILLLVYFPVIIPTGFLLNFIPKIADPTLSQAFDSLVKIFGGGVGNAFASWLCMSGIAAIQSFWVVGLSRFLMRKKRGEETTTAVTDSE